MKYSRTTLMELTHRYKNVLKKCALINATILMGIIGINTNVMAEVLVLNEDKTYSNETINNFTPQQKQQWEQMMQLLNNNINAKK